MTQSHVLGIVQNWDIYAAFIIPLLFPVAIAYIWPWWKDELGWTMVLVDLLLSAALLPSFLHRALGVPINTYVFQWIVVISVGLIPIVIIWRTIVVFKTQKQAVREVRRRKSRHAAEETNV